MIHLDSVTKSYAGPDGPIVALGGVDLRVERGEFVAVVGPSGSGKSTLLFTVGGLLRPESGEVMLDGKSVYQLSRAQRARLRVTNLGFVFQTFNLVPYLSCLENVTFPALLAGRSRIDALRKAAALLERLGLSSRARHRPSELSVGERQRVAVARAMINGPKLLVADEPTANLDSVAASHVLDLLLELSADGQSILMVTHDRCIADAAQRVVELDRGRITGCSVARKAVSA